MGSYVSTAKIFHLPLRNGRIVPGNFGICFDILENEIEVDGVIEQRYWIELN